MKRALIILASVAILMGASRHAKNLGQAMRTTAGAVKILDGVALNAAAGSRTTPTFDIGGIGAVTVYIDYTHGSTNVTAVTMQCLVGPTTALMGTVPQLEWSTGTGTSVGATWSHAVTGDTLIPWQTGPLNSRYFKCVIGSTGTPDGTDLIDVYMRAGVL